MVVVIVLMACCLAGAVELPGSRDCLALAGIVCCWRLADGGPLYSWNLICLEMGLLGRLAHVVAPVCDAVPVVVDELGGVAGSD